MHFSQFRTAIMIPFCLSFSFSRNSLTNFQQTKTNQLLIQNRTTNTPHTKTKYTNETAKKRLLNPRRYFALVHFELVLVIEAGRVACIANDEACSVIVHATLAPPYEEVPRLAHRTSAVQERGANRC